MKKMKSKQLLSLLLFVSLMLTMFLNVSEVSAASGSPEKDDANSRIFANGTAVVIKEVSGSTNLYLATDTSFTSPVFEDISDYFIYGGWAEGDKTGDTSVTVLSGNFNKTIFAGSRNGSINGNTNCLIKDGTFKWVYGGGSSASVSGKANLKIDGGMFTETTFGGGSNDTANVATTNFTINGGTFKWVYGGGWDADVGAVNLTINSGTFNEDIYGGSHNGNISNSTNVVVNDGTFGKNIFGGCISGNVTGISNLTIHAGEFETVTGGGVSGEIDHVRLTITGGTFWRVNGGSFEGEGNESIVTVIEGGTIENELWCGSEQSAVKGDVEVHLKGGKYYKVITPYEPETEISGKLTVYVYSGADFSGGTGIWPLKDDFTGPGSAIVYMYGVTVNSGSGGGEYAEGANVTITADEPSTGKEFDKWEVTSGTLLLSDATENPITFNMPAENIEIKATYRDKVVTPDTYNVTVDGGTGSGNFAEGDTVNISAKPAPSGKRFDKWTTSDGVSFIDANSESTSFTMPNKAVTVTATYKAQEATLEPDPDPEKPIDQEKTEKVQYKITKGANGKWDKTSKSGLEFISDGDFDKFEEVKVDGKTLDKKDYSAKAGSTIVTLKDSFLSTLGKGDHNLTIVFEDGEVETKFTIAGTGTLPKTGETVYPTILAGFILVLSGLFIYRKKEA